MIATAAYLAVADMFLLFLTYFMARPALAKLGETNVKLGFWKGAACIVILQTLAPLIALAKLFRWVVIALLARLFNDKQVAAMVVDTMEEGLVKEI